MATTLVVRAELTYLDLTTLLIAIQRDHERHEKQKFVLNSDVVEKSFRPDTATAQVQPRRH